MNTIDYLKANAHETEGGFVSKAEYLKDNWQWLKYSYAIAIKVRRRIKETGLTQKELAEQLGCTQQHVSVLLGGKANMTLETIAKLEQTLSIDLIGHGLQEFGYLNDSKVSGPIPEGFKTSKLVNGYKTRKKKGPKSAK